jgi:signal transduction histidine kinase
MRANSLALRLFVSATVWTVLILVATGLLLSSLSRLAVARAFDRRLGVYLKTLIADVASPEIPNERAGQTIGEPLFDLPLSGWYWQVVGLDPKKKTEIYASRSLWDGVLPRLQDMGVEPGPDGIRKSYVQGQEEQRLRLVERTIDLGEEGRFLVSVAGDASEISEEIVAFDRTLAMTFAGLALVLLITTLFQVRFGLAPLNRISQQLAAIRSGRAEKLEGRFPVEIAPLARETNALLDSNREIVERARTHVGNLAHALKTPLSVMVNEANARPDDPLAAKVTEQTVIMREQVTRHLERARLAARVAVIGTVTDVGPVMQSLVRTMEKTHHGKDLAVALSMPDEVKFRGEQQDLEEMIGNLVDNAFKWASTRVAMEIGVEQPEPGRQVVRIMVDDDGPGLTPSEREQVARRGRRLDETKPGSGLGLSIVVELASLYGGALNLGNSPIGGLRAELMLPAAG